LFEKGAAANFFFLGSNLVVPAWADYCPLILHACQLKKNDVLPFSSVDKAQA
jgi:hypothetical protein